jgi:hypothetical protein
LKVGSYAAIPRPIPLKLAYMIRMCIWAFDVNPEKNMGVAMEVLLR